MTQIDRRSALKHVAASAFSLIPIIGCSKPSGVSGTPPTLISEPVTWIDDITFRRSEDRGTASHGWLEAKYSFSFSRYRDPDHMGFRALRVINEDRIQGGGGFPMHPHRDMEIVTYILDGALEHRDNLGNGGVITPGRVQWMSAGTGMRHSEFNPSKTKRTHLLQIWIHPDQRGHKPAYGEQIISASSTRNGLQLVAAPGAEAPLPIRANARIFAAILDSGQRLTYDNAKGRHLWLQLARGQVGLNGKRMSAGDGCSISQAGHLEVRAHETSEFLLFDLA